MLRFLTPVAVALLVLGGCAGAAVEPRVPVAAVQPVRGDLISFTLIETRDRDALQRTADELPGGIRVQYGADLYRMIYWTRFKGRPARVSGLVAVPRGVAPAGVVAYLHGTTTSRDASPSLPGRADGDQETAVFAGAGFVTVLPDYVGMGESDLPQAYVVTQPQVDASIDMLRALRRPGGVQGLESGKPLFLVGFSQGGQSAAGLHRALERSPLAGYALKGTVAIAGPHDLRGAIVGKLDAPDAESPRNVAYLAFAATAYAAYYDRPLADLLTPDLAARVPGLFDGSHSPGDIIGQLPSDTRALFRPEALRALKAGTGWFDRALRENETWDWAPHAPLRIVTGEADTDVPPASSRALLDHAGARGGAVSLQSVPEADHMGAAAQSYAPALTWFQALARGS